MLFEDYCWSVLSPKLAKLNSFMKVVSGIFLFAEGLTVMYFQESQGKLSLKIFCKIVL